MNSKYSTQDGNISLIRASIERAYGQLLGRLEARGLTVLVQSQQQAIEAAARARVALLGANYEQAMSSLMNSVNRSVLTLDFRAEVLIDVEAKLSFDRTVQGFFDPFTAKSFLIADNLTADSAPGVLMHEVGIHMAADGSMLSVFEQAARLVKFGRDRFLVSVRKQMEEAGTTTGEEAAAYITEAYERDRVNAPFSVVRWLKDFVAAVRAWAFEKGILIENIDLTVADIAAIARANAMRLVRGDSLGDVKLSMGEDSNSAMTNSPPEFFSQLERAIGQVPDRIATMAAPQWKLWLDSNGPKLGVKKDEIEWSGIKDYLDLRGKDKVTRDELAAYLAGSGVRVMKTMLGKKVQDEGLYSIVEEDERYNVVAAGTRMFADAVTYEQAKDAIAEMKVNDKANEPDPTKYKKYTLSGGENYREVLITLPTRVVTRRLKSTEDSINENRDVVAYNKFVADFEEKYGSLGGFARNAPPEERERYETLGSRANQAERNFRLIGNKEEILFGDQYKSSHWGEPNVIAHIRVDDRVDSNGNKTLMVHEIQSDWGQSARTEGVATQRVPLTDLETLELDKLDEKPLRQRSPVEQARFQELFAREAGGKTDGVPNAPFIGKTENWLTLALKRTIMMAVEGGYDKVAFVTGQQVMDFFDLSKSISAISYEQAGNGLYEINAQDMSGKTFLDEDEVTLSRIEELVGKDMAKKIEAGEGEKSGDG